MRIGVPKILNYKTTEQKYIRWVDGRHVYQKTLAITTPAGTGEQPMPHGITNFDELLAYEGYVTLQNGNKVPFPRIGTNPSVSCIELLRADSINLIGYVGTGFTSVATIVSGYITIWYLKTT
jgi:hypothetical protein